MPYCRPIGVVFLAVAGGGVDRAGALLERDVIGQDAERIAFQERVAEDGVLHASRRGSVAMVLVIASSRTFRR